MDVHSGDLARLADTAKVLHFDLGLRGRNPPGCLLGTVQHLDRRRCGLCPGRRYPLTASAHRTVLMEEVAGVGRVVATTPPNEGIPSSISVVAMHLVGADDIFVLGRVQAIAALALDTETIDSVSVLPGPGNAFIAETK
ncbi:histidinol dehydrogenase [Saccharopolyspora sp. NPDC002686]|uniref:histidinol dehydrogenase n=1 Tax=Saccharopolyspora sp. NPDC002686 TaxID=3154541 RepID=UPI00331EE989